MKTFTVYTATHIGQRKENQDRVIAGRLSGEAVAVVLCDGMGGAAAGGYAASLTAEFVSKRLSGGFRAEMSRNALRNLLLTSVTAANALVWEQAQSDNNLFGMGTTCVAAVLFRERAYIMNVGDSRFYHISGNNITQITRDHTRVRQLIDDGILREEDEKLYPARNVITKAIGGESIITPDYFELDLGFDSAAVVCSDGLYNMLPDDRIAEFALKSPASGSAERLVSYAAEQGGRDNITVAVIV
ncbi:MAG: protein phosphatase 2C domain-containing protein [Oscillospiraceae bacterium]|jgi:protein phosphatase|nr:protein phosphatase 2C domain-containing protein [Oscillospiraceae bacterium]